MQKLIHKIRDQSGETLTEALVALLISALALTMLAGGMSTSAGLITKSKKWVNDYQNEIEKVVNFETTPTKEKVTFTEGDKELDSRTVECYETEKTRKKIVVYKEADDEE